MSLLDEAQNLTRRPGGTCGIAILKAAYPDPAELEEAFASAVTSSALAFALKRRGYPISEHTIQRHRRGGCACEPD
jgi:hypothetical protein